MKWTKSSMWSKSDESDIPKEVFEDAEKAYDYAEEIGKRIPELEDVIAKDPGYSFLYARDILKGRFLKGEDAIAKSSGYSYHYAEEVIKGRWLKSEDVILKSIFKKEYLNFLKSKGYDTEELFGEE